MLSPALPIAWPNLSFAKPATGYLRVSHVPNMNRRLFIGSTDPHQRFGLLQIAVFGKKNENIAVTGEVAGKVAAHFPANLKMRFGEVTVRVTASPTVAQSLDDDMHVLVPVTVPYECFA